MLGALLYGNNDTVRYIMWFTNSIYYGTEAISLSLKQASDINKT